jgi:hypothetical protein
MAMDDELRQQFEQIETRIQYHLGRLRRRAREMQRLIQGH